MANAAKEAAQAAQKPVTEEEAVAKKLADLDLPHLDRISSKGLRAVLFDDLVSKMSRYVRRPQLRGHGWGWGAAGRDADARAEQPAEAEQRRHRGPYGP